MDVRRLQIVGESTYALTFDHVSELNICDKFNKQKRRK